MIGFIQMDVSQTWLPTWEPNPAMGVDFDSSFPEIKDMNGEPTITWTWNQVKKPADIELGYNYRFLYQCSSATCNWLRDLSREEELLPA